jgi:HK97 family phage portal protein
VSFLEHYQRPTRRRAVAGRVEQRDISSVPWNVGGPLRPSLVTVEQDNALAPVYAAWRLIGDVVASLPVHAYRDLGDRRQRMSSLPQLFQNPSTLGTLTDWVFRLVHSMVSRGNAVGWVLERDGFGYPTLVEWQSPESVYVDQDGPDASFARPVWYLGGVRVPTEDIVHIPWFPVAGRVWGLSPMEAYAATVRVGLEARSYQVDWFAGGGVPPGTLQNTQKTLEPKQADTIRARFMASLRRHEPFVHGADWVYTPMAVSQHEAKFVETMKLSADEIASIYGVPPEKIGGTSGGPLTYNTVEQHSIDMMQWVARPWCVKLEAAFYKLLPRPQYVRFNLDAGVRTDVLTRYRTYAIARQIGLLSIDEIRELEDREPLPGGEGKEFAPLAKADTPDDSQAEQPPAQLPRPRAVS